MKLLVDCHGFDSRISQGITSYIKGIYTILPKINKEIEYYFVATDIDNIMSIFGEADNIHYIPLTSKNRIHRLFFEIPNIIKKNGIDIAHFQYVAPLIKNCKTIITLHDVLFLDYPQYFPTSYKLSKSFPFKLSAKRADLLCTVSEYSRKRISAHYGIEESEIIVTPNAVDEEFYNVEGEKPTDFPDKYILYVSRVEPRKNHKIIVEAFSRLKLAEKGYKLVMIGRETVATPDIHLALEGLPFLDRNAIMMIPQVSFSELKLWYKYADLFLYPSIAEGFGIPPIEAGATGIPVISNNSTAMSDFSFFGDNLIDIFNKGLLDKRILENLKRRDDNRLSDVSKQIRTTYNWRLIAEKFNNELIKHFR